MSRLPEGWIETSFMEVFDIQGGTQPPKAQFKYAPQEGYIRLLQIRDFGDRPVPTYIPNKSGLKTCSKEDVLIGRYGASVGRICTGMEGAYNVALAKVITPKEIDRRFVFYLLQSDLFQKPILATERSAQDGFNKDDLERICIPLIPLAEQRRIAAKLETLLGKVDAYQQRLVKIPVILKRFRQAVLAAAYAGRLTAKWRKEHADVEPASMLIKEKRFKLAIPNDELPLLPDTWEGVSLGNYAQCSRGRFSVRPRNDPAYFDGQYPFIQIGALSDEGGWITSHRQTLNDRGLAVSKKFPKGTVVIAIVGATIGNTGILAYDMCFTDSMVGIETGDEISNRYVELFLRHRKEEIRQSSYAGGGQPNIKLEVLNPYPLALPPLEEQYEIVRHVETLFKLADQIEARYQKAKAQVDKLPQSILAKAFRGELVPTEAELARREGRDYEPASVLLERIRSGRAEHTQGRKEKVRSQPRRARLARGAKPHI